MGNYYSMMFKRIDEHYSREEDKSGGAIKKEVALKLQLFRKESNKTFAEIGQMVGVTRHQIMRWEARKSKPSQLAMQRLKDLKII